MNNKGQTLVLFVVLIPLILGIFAFVFDTSYMYRENTKLEGIARNVLKSVSDDKKNINKAKTLIKENDNNIKIITLNDKEIHLTNEIDAIFGKIIGLSKYNLDIDLIYKYENGKFVIEEKGK